MKFLLVTIVCAAIFFQETFCGECRKPSDCSPGECCTIGMMRYARPQCSPLLRKGENCRVGNAPEDRTFYYPDGEEIKTTGVYRMPCPCDGGLECIRGKCT